MKQLYTLLIPTLLIAGSTPGQTKNLPFKHTMAVSAADSKEDIIRKAAQVVPTANQYTALQHEFIAFIHFGPNTFTRLEWGSGKEDPRIFDLRELDTDQWCQALKAAGIKMVILTVKHHDGFVLWQSRYTKHGIMATGFQQGKGDILRALTSSCAKYGLKVGVYLSPADLYQIESPDGFYGNLSKYTTRTIPRAVPGRPFANKTSFRVEADDYNEYFMNQLSHHHAPPCNDQPVGIAGSGTHPGRTRGSAYGRSLDQSTVAAHCLGYQYRLQTDTAFSGCDGGQIPHPVYAMQGYTRCQPYLGSLLYKPTAPIAGKAQSPGHGDDRTVSGLVQLETAWRKCGKKPAKWIGYLLYAGRIGTWYAESTLYWPLSCCPSHDQSHGGDQR
ncbi:alpha-L-fucosidase [Paraflavitalea speifideaquila]|uniref:alpha-L-fucosidase n=1 Tax=Paraflavitalea speifideaquila TaxID=3076558 RepID=UPI0028EFD3F4|nr:alpha-L-fucosidase [Paraflavitalea speifideiaquila]